MKYVFFINPAAGKGAVQDGIINSIKEYFKDRQDDFIIHTTSYKGDAEKTARELAQTGEQLTMFACGGEGTVYEVLNGIVGYENVSLGVVPCGSANDFLKFFNEKQKFMELSRQIEGERISVDIIKAGDRYCLNGCSVGMDAMVANDMSLFKKWPLVSGPLAYKLAIVKTFLRKLGVKIKITVDNDEPYEAHCLFAVVANAPYYGGGYMAAPKADPSDNKLDFTQVDVISRFRVLKFLSLYSKGLHGKLDYCTMRNCNSMEFVSERPIPVNLDGEILESKGMKFEIVKDAVSFVVPKGVKVRELTKA